MFTREQKLPPTFRRFFLKFNAQFVSDSGCFLFQISPTSRGNTTLKVSLPNSFVFRPVRDLEVRSELFVCDLAKLCCGQLFKSLTGKPVVHPFKILICPTVTRHTHQPNYITFENVGLNFRNDRRDSLRNLQTMYSYLLPNEVCIKRL